jgi:hypothetical protein
MKTCKRGHTYEDHIKQCVICSKARREIYKTSRKHLREEYNTKNKDTILEKSRAYYINNKQACLESSRAYHARNKEKIRQQRKEQYVITREAKLQYKRGYIARRLRQDPLYKLTVNIRGLIRQCFKNKGWSKKSKAIQILGCSFNELESKLIMSAIDNYGYWLDIETYQIDHIVPVSSATNENELISLNHFSNLQYLYPHDNRDKSCRLDWKLKKAP